MKTEEYLNELLLKNETLNDLIAFDSRQVESILVLMVRDNLCFWSDCQALKDKARALSKTSMFSTVAILKNFRRRLKDGEMVENILSDISLEMINVMIENNESLF